MEKNDQLEVNLENFLGSENDREEYNQSPDDNAVSQVDAIVRAENTELSEDNVHEDEPLAPQNLTMATPAHPDENSNMNDALSEVHTSGAQASETQDSETPASEAEASEEQTSAAQDSEVQAESVQAPSIQEINRSNNQNPASDQMQHIFREPGNEDSHGIQRLGRGSYFSSRISSFRGSYVSHFRPSSSGACRSSGVGVFMSPNGSGGSQDMGLGMNLGIGLKMGVSMDLGFGMGNRSTGVGMGLARGSHGRSQRLGRGGHGGLGRGSHGRGQRLNRGGHGVSGGLGRGSHGRGQRFSQGGHGVGGGLARSSPGRSQRLDRGVQSVGGGLGRQMPGLGSGLHRGGSVMSQGLLQNMGVGMRRSQCVGLGLRRGGQVVGLGFAQSVSFSQGGQEMGPGLVRGGAGVRPASYNTSQDSLNVGEGHQGNHGNLDIGQGRQNVDESGNVVGQKGQGVLGRQVVQEGQRVQKGQGVQGGQGARGGQGFGIVAHVIDQGMSHIGPHMGVRSQGMRQRGQDTSPNIDQRGRGINLDANQGNAQAMYRSTRRRRHQESGQGSTAPDVSEVSQDSQVYQELMRRATERIFQDFAQILRGLSVMETNSSQSNQGRSSSRPFQFGMHDLSNLLSPLPRGLATPLSGLLPPFQTSNQRENRMSHDKNKRYFPYQRHSHYQMASLSGQGHFAHQEASPELRAEVNVQEQNVQDPATSTSGMNQPDTTCHKQSRIENTAMNKELTQTSAEISWTANDESEVIELPETQTLEKNQEQEKGKQDMDLNKLQVEEVGDEEDEVEVIEVEDEENEKGEKEQI